MAVPSPPDEVAINAQIAIDQARKALDDPEFAKRLNPGEKVTYEARIKAAEDALKAYKTANPGGAGMVGSSVALRTPASGGNPAFGIGIAVIFVVGYLVKGAVDNAQHKALILALSLLATQHQQIATRPTAVEEWALAAVDGSSLQWLLMLIVLDKLKIPTIIDAVKKDIKENPNCCGDKVKEFEKAAADLLAALRSPTLVPDAERIRRSRVLVKAIIGLYVCLKIEPPFIVRTNVMKPQTCPK